MTRPSEEELIAGLKALLVSIDATDPEQMGCSTVAYCAAQDLLSRASIPATPAAQEWVTAPRVATPEMCGAIFDPDGHGTAPACDLERDADNEVVKRIWSALLASAPPPQAEGGV
jgi:hypothetical protein